MENLKESDVSERFLECPATSMPSLAFIMGVIPLMISHGAGAEMRQSIGISVFSGMLGVTLFGLFMTPVFYLLARQISGKPLHSATLPDAPEERPVTEQASD